MGGEDTIGIVGPTVNDRLYNTFLSINHVDEPGEKGERHLFKDHYWRREPIDAFDTFVEEWKAEGGDAITAEVQAIVDNK